LLLLVVAEGDMLDMSGFFVGTFIPVQSVEA